MGAVRKQLAPEGGIQAIEQAKRISPEYGTSNLLGRFRQSNVVTVNFSVVVDGVLLQLRRCKNFPFVDSFFWKLIFLRHDFS